ncbi:glycosyltransferase [Calidifontibacter indicus]|uniref:Glycosyltransferase involved in cell wall biosynthesis n=1 Tax=Calidifontibacter indicus TaxID=419650 RepID=A0A3D9UPK2_9MICO|nr:glycosyltransferase [Calidifontibacter indicus]REF30363.1 glycosyltransferase involved in cell wall biosynthesis [Calidifontibacter indicus]
MTAHDLVVISLEAWDEVWRRNQHLVHRLLLTDPALRVLWVEPSVDPLHAARSGRRARPGRGLRPGPSLPGENGTRILLLEPTKLLPRKIDRGQDLRWARHIAKTARRIGFERPLLWVNDPRGADVLDATGWPAIYDITDDWLQADRTTAELSRLERDESLLLDRCAQIVVCSPALERTKQRAGRTTLIPNAVDPDTYRRPAPRPHDLPVGANAVYVGTLHTDRLDVSLAIRTAERLAGRATLTLVGPNLLTPDDRTRLEQSGVVLLGQKPVMDVPAYLQHADVLVVPHLLNEFTDSLDPIKVYEYAAVGRPVVSTNVAGFRDARDDRVTIADGEAFADAVAEAVPGRWRFPDRADRPVPSWDDRARQMASIIFAATGWT